MDCCLGSRFPISLAARPLDPASASCWNSHHPHNIDLGSKPPVVLRVAYDLLGFRDEGLTRFGASQGRLESIQDILMTSKLIWSLLILSWVWFSSWNRNTHIKKEFIKKELVNRNTHHGIGTLTLKRNPPQKDCLDMSFNMAPRNMKKKGSRAPPPPPLTKTLSASSKTS